MVRRAADKKTPKSRLVIVLLVIALLLTDERVPVGLISSEALVATEVSESLSLGNEKRVCNIMILPPQAMIFYMSCVLNIFYLSMIGLDTKLYSYF
jgi:hypothetical protein